MSARRGRPPVPEGTKKPLRQFVRVKVKGEWRYEHIVVAEQLLGRPLRPEESIEWRNGDRSDNRPRNLKVVAWVTVYPSARTRRLGNFCASTEKEPAPSARDFLTYQRVKRWYQRDWRRRRRRAGGSSSHRRGGA